MRTIRARLTQRWSLYSRNERTAVMSLALLVAALVYLPVSIFLL